MLGVSQVKVVSSGSYQKLEKLTNEFLQELDEQGMVVREIKYQHVEYSYGKNEQNFSSVYSCMIHYAKV